MSQMRDKIIAAYDQHMLRKSVLSIRGGAGVIESILKHGKYKTVLEIGTYRGVGAAEISQYCEKVHTIDLKFGKIEINRRDGRDATDASHDRETFWKTLRIENIELHLVENDAEKVLLIADLDFDFAVIDGAHDSIAGVALDFNAVKKCGSVLFHDVDRNGVPSKDCVIDFVESLPKHEITKLDIFAWWRRSENY